MKILIYGAGALGLLFASYLSKQNDVVAVTRKKYADSINEKSLKIIKGNKEETANFKCYNDLSSVDFKPDFIILAAKSFDIDNACSDLKKYYEKVKIATIQNGIYTEECIKNTFSSKNAIPLSVMIGSRILDSNTIEEFFHYGLNIGFLDKNAEQDAHILHDIFLKSGINSIFSENIMKDKWHKFMFYCAGAILNSLTATRNLEYEHNKWIVDRALKEIVEVAGHLDLPFDINSLSEEVFHQLMNFKPKEWFTSVGIDLRKGKKTEIDYINGYVIKLSERFNVDVPINRTLYSLVKTLEKTKYYSNIRL